MDTSTILDVSNVGKTFPGVVALDNVSLKVQKGQVHGIVGENGAGKSTLMKILSGVYKKDSGSIIFDGKEMNVTQPMQSMQLGLSIVYQEFNLVNTMTVGENIFLGRFHEAGGMKEIHRKAKELLTRIECDISTRTCVADLSISEKQMVEIAKALSLDAKLIILDEPSTTLTNKEMQRLEHLIFTLKNDGITIIYISHKLDEIFKLCDSVTIMRDGKIIATRDVMDLDRNEMISMMVGRSIENEYPPRPECAGDVLMEVRNLNTRKLHDISFCLKAGEILGLVGLVGAGRTEIVRAIFGADRKKSGEVYIEGQQVEINNPMEALRAGIGLVPEDRKQQGLILKFSVANNITMSNFEHFAEHGVINSHTEQEIASAKVKELAVKTPALSTKILSLSGGNQQKCIIARFLQMNPRILFLDEPTRGIDVGAKYEIYMLMKKIAESGRSIVMISSELPEVLNMSNRVLTISDGRIVGEFDPQVSSSEEIAASVLA